MMLTSYWYALMTSFLFAGTTIAGKIILVSKPPILIACSRFIISSICLMPFIDFKEFRRLTVRKVSIFLSIGFFGIFLFNLLLFNALRFTSASTVALISALNPLMTLAATSLVGLRMPNKQQRKAFVLAFLGVALVVTKGKFDPALMDAGTGELLIFASVVSNVIYSFLLKKMSDQFSPRALIFGAGMSGLFFLLPLAYFEGLYATLPFITTYEWLLLGFIGSLGTALSIVCYAVSIKKVGPAMSNLLVYSPMPIFVFLMAYFFLGNTISLWQAGGACLVLGSLFLAIKT
jgi:drug/metabolite transporter (DMT)-like permease